MKFITEKILFYNSTGTIFNFAIAPVSNLMEAILKLTRANLPSPPCILSLDYWATTPLKWNMVSYQSARPINHHNFISYLPYLNIKENDYLVGGLFWLPRWHPPILGSLGTGTFPPWRIAQNSSYHPPSMPYHTHLNGNKSQCIHPTSKSLYGDGRCLMYSHHWVHNPPVFLLLCMTHQWNLWGDERIRRKKC